MMIYTQTSPRVPELAKRIDATAAQTGLGKEMPITVDAAEGFTWPWAWYLREYTKVGYPDLSQSPSDVQGTVLLLDANNVAPMEPFLGRYDSGQRYPHRWWFPEDYRNLTIESWAGSILSPAAWRERWDYFYNRKLPTPLGASEALAFFPKGATAGAPAGGAPNQPPAPPPLAAQPLQGAQLLAGKGTISDGSLQAPKGVAVDRSGNVFVADSRANKVVKFDAAGRLVAQTGRLGTGDGEFTEPWGVAVDKSGNVYVADTWNHRIQKFDDQLRFVRRWGSYGNVSGAALSSQTPINFFGPRDVAVDGEGNLWVTDTGNKRVQKFSPDGAPLGVFGAPGRGPGQFQEPVSLAITSTGQILVVDTWNRRVQRFTRDFRFEGEFPVSGWAGQSVANKPYIAVDSRGNVVVTDPESHRILRYDASGAPLAVLGRVGSDATALNGPGAVAFDDQGRLYITDG
ncbi:MAG: 6-bladed beta-propeller, partial [Chloroflexota bacterium]